ncbi:MAG: DUF3047 domain-containing protein [Lentisphaerae bacterium]|nr:DUF3047 domain-containing protein [Lentisphaerota bacterium]
MLRIVFMVGSVLAVALSAFGGADSGAVRIAFSDIPKGWVVKTKPGTPAAVFSVVDCPEAAGLKALNMEADKASASLTGQIKDVDLNATPIMRWSWRVTAFPEGADGLVAARDDQAIGIYLGSGGFLNQKSVAYRWETDTPRGTNGRAEYAAGVVRVAWHCLRNRQDGTNGAFLVEERNVAEDYFSAFGSKPKSFGLSISCNSQYTGTRAAAQLEWIEFRPATNAAPAGGVRGQ